MEKGRRGIKGGYIQRHVPVDRGARWVRVPYSDIQSKFFTRNNYPLQSLLSAVEAFLSLLILHFRKTRMACHMKAAQRSNRES